LAEADEIIRFYEEKKRKVQARLEELESLQKGMKAEETAEDN